MPRSEVYQLRLYPGEKEKLSNLAEKGGHQSIATMIRQTFGLDAMGGLPQNPTDPSPEVAKQIHKIAKRIPPKSTDMVSDILETVKGSEIDPVRVAQLKGQGYTTRVAERMAKAEQEPA